MWLSTDVMSIPGGTDGIGLWPGIPCRELVGGSGLSSSGSFRPLHPEALHLTPTWITFEVDPGSSVRPRGEVLVDRATGV